MFTLEWERRQKRRQRHQAASDLVGGASYVPVFDDFAILEKTVNG